MPVRRKAMRLILGIDKALSDVRNIRIRTVPPHLKDSHYSGAKELEHGVGYKYAHDYPGHYVKQQYLPDELVGTVYYAMTENGVERQHEGASEAAEGGVTGFFLEIS